MENHDLEEDFIEDRDPRWIDVHDFSAERILELIELYKLDLTSFSDSIRVNSYDDCYDVSIQVTGKTCSAAMQQWAIKFNASLEVK